MATAMTNWSSTTVDWSSLSDLQVFSWAVLDAINELVHQESMRELAKIRNDANVGVADAVASVRQPTTRQSSKTFSHF